MTIGDVENAGGGDLGPRRDAVAWPRDPEDVERLREIEREREDER